MFSDFAVLLLVYLVILVCLWVWFDCVIWEFWCFAFDSRFDGFIVLLCLDLL